MTQSLPVKTTTSIWDEIDKMQNSIMERAYEIFRWNGSALGKDLDDWLQAERELVWKPAIDLEEKDNKCYLKVAVPGVDAKDLKIEVTAEDILIRAEVKRERKEDKGEVHCCEFASGNLFRSVHLPKKIDTENVKAELNNGVLSLTATLAVEAKARKVAIEAA